LLFQGYEARLTTDYTTLLEVPLYETVFGATDSPQTWAALFQDLRNHPNGLSQSISNNIT